MSKSKPTETILHRIELQTTEREALEMVAASITARNATKSIENLTKGAGNLVTPLLSATGAGVAAALGLIAWYGGMTPQDERIEAYFESGGRSEDEFNKEVRAQRAANFRMKLNQIRNAISTELMKLSNNDSL